MRIERFGWNKESLVGFAWHQGIGFVCFLIDMAVIFALVYGIDLEYPFAVTAGFLVATTAAYFMSRNSIYANSEQPHSTALFYYFFVSLAALFITVGGTVFFTEVIELPFYIGRTLVGIFIGVSGYLVDCLVTFKLR